MMKIVLVLAAVLVVAYAEMCRENSNDCVTHGITMCGNGYHVVCHDHQCQCTGGPTGHGCQAQSDCTCDNGRTPHCVDGQCHCGRD